MSLFTTWVVFTTLIFSSSSYAAFNDFDCSKIRNYHDFYKCSLQKHPEFEISKLKVKEADAVLSQASQWQNPNLEVKSVAGTNAGENAGSTEVSLAVSVSQLWTRGAIKDIGRAEKKIAEIESQVNLLDVKKQLIRDLFRFRQVDEEIELLNETMAAFEKIRNQFKGRLARGPEQEITLNLVELATSDYALKRNHLTVEKGEILARLKGVWGTQFELKTQFFPPAKEKWPNLPQELNLAQSFSARKVVAEAEKASAQESLAVRESWPAVSAGPMIQRNTEGPTQFLNYGFNLSVSLPLFSLNGGGRELASTRAQQARLSADYTAKKAQLERDLVVQKYKSAVDSIRQSSARQEVVKKHTRIDNLFKQGVVSGNLVIEAHRQINEYTVSQHEHEITAIEAFLEIKALTGDENIDEVLND